MDMKFFHRTHCLHGKDVEDRLLGLTEVCGSLKHPSFLDDGLGQRRGRDRNCSMGTKAALGGRDGLISGSRFY
ncbi:hypothetical protein RRG08_061780 [Elysia crispata]|uniref:Uncharacterized protein n=1 Tax=Elysia crispata TaxID=231223 RepID=A0AAE1DU89_9GAST|nr:hypothetical protein RRG08_061780 [Elysia crispata]